jgi:hypothetical protein
LSFLINSVIHWINKDCFEIDISPPLRKEKVDSITGYSDGFLMINFMGGETVRVDYPINPDNLPELVEIKLLRWKNLEKGLFPNAYFVVVVADYIKEHLNEIKNAISLIREERCVSP